MREILFRGKRIKDGAWIEGNLLTGRWYLNGRPITAISPVDNVFFPHCEISEYEEVIPETVGQYTGLTANGKKIFEGDILAHWNEEQEKYTGKCVVKYGEFNCSCCDGVYGWYLDGGDIRFIDEGDSHYEVIGNIHDNRELLEVNNG